MKDWCTVALLRKVGGGRKKGGVQVPLTCSKTMQAENNNIIYYYYFQPNKAIFFKLPDYF